MIKVSRGFYAFGAGLFLLAAAVSRIAATSAGRGKPIFSQFFLLISLLFVLSLYYKAWLAIQDGYARTTPGRAVGYSFIPIFNVYWAFVVMVGFVADYNSFIERKKLDRRPLTSWNFWLLAVCWLIAWLPHFPAGGFIILLVMLLQMWAIEKIAAAVDGLPIPEPLPEPVLEGEGGEEKKSEPTPPTE
jgi:hypothetical protein